jgi:tetratricopeptide (TPR) repeat protein
MFFFALTGLILLVGALIFFRTKLESRRLPVISQIYFRYDEYLLQRKIRAKPYDGPLHFDLAYLYLDNGDIDKFERELRKAVSLDPDSLAGIFSLVIHYETTRKFEEALQMCLIGIRYDKEYRLPFHYELARMYCNLGKRDDALKAYQETLEHIDSYKIEGRDYMRRDAEKKIIAIRKDLACS